MKGQNQKAGVVEYLEDHAKSIGHLKTGLNDHGERIIDLESKLGAQISMVNWLLKRMDRLDDGGDKNLKTVAEAVKAASGIHPGIPGREELPPESQVSVQRRCRGCSAPFVYKFTAGNTQEEAGHLNWLCPSCEITMTGTQA